MVMRNIHKYLLGSLLFASAAFASETGSYAYRAHKLYEAGRYFDAMRMLQNALEMSAKEADIEGESRVLLDMAQILFHSYDYENATQYLSTVREKELNKNGRLALLRLRMQIQNHQEKYSEALALYRNAQDLLAKENLGDGPKALVQLEACIAMAGAGQSSDIAPLLEDSKDLLDDEAPGLVSLTEARIADIGKDYPKATELYKSSLEQAQKRQRSWIAGQILIRLGQLSLQSGNKDAGADYLLRAAKLYMQLQLDRPFLLAAEAYLALGQDDRSLGMEVGAAKLRLNPQTQP